MMTILLVIIMLIEKKCLFWFVTKKEKCSVITVVGPYFSVDFI